MELEDRFYKGLLENLYDGVYYVDKHRQITFWNKSAERITGYSKEEVVGLKCADNILRHIDEKGNELCKKGCPAGKTLKDGKIRDSDIYLHHKNGHRVPVSVRVAPIKDANGNIIGAVEIFTDNSKRLDIIKEIESLKKEVFVDALTQAGNRKYAQINLNTRLNELKTYQIPFGILFLDIDHFKTFNDTYGHNVGDQVLQMVSKTISNILRRMDVISRWGGEEFVVIIPNIKINTLKNVAERIRKFIERSWLTVNDENLKVTVSVGGTMATPEDGIDSLVERADSQMYQSKKTGRNCVTIA